jgi:ribose transport system permease protein
MKRTKPWLSDLLALAAILTLLVALFSLLSEHFLTARTLGTIANRIPTLVVVSTGMTLVLISGMIDLSVGSVLALASALLGVALADWHWPFWAAALLALATGAAAGGLNGSLAVLLNVPSFIVTLGMLEAARGLAYLATDSQTKYLGAAAQRLAEPIGGLAVAPAFLLALVVAAVGQLVLSRTVLGRHLVAVGTNEPATALAGVDPRPVKITVFIVGGLLTGLGAVLHVARLGSADPNAGMGLELSAIAAVVIGGTSLMGGRGSVLKTLFGVLVIAILETGLAHLGVSEPTKRVITGAVIVIAVGLDAWRSRSSSLGAVGRWGGWARRLSSRNSRPT